MKKKSILLIVLALVFISFGCDNKSSNDDALKFKKDYESLNGLETATKGVTYRKIEIDENNSIIYTTFKEVKEKIDNKESFILYVGFSACPWCRSVIPYILESAKENGISEIYYINVREDNTKESDLRGYYTLDENSNLVYEIYPDKYYHDILKTLDAYLEPYILIDDNGEEIETGESRLSAPTLIAYTDGKAIALDECISEKQKNGYQDLTEEMIIDMKEKANNVFAKYKNNCSSDDKSCK